MMNVHVLFKFASNPYGGVEINTTSSSGSYYELSPFVLTVPCSLNNAEGKLFNSIIFENLWQFSKVYKGQLGQDGEPSPEWFKWRMKGWADKVAHRYPMGKGVIPEYSYWDGNKLGYIEARKQIYASVYAENVIKIDSYKILYSLYENLRNANVPLILRDYDAYDHIRMGMSLKDVINNPDRKMGHAFVLAMLLEGKLEECLSVKA